MCKLSGIQEPAASGSAKKEPRASQHCPTGTARHSLRTRKKLLVLHVRESSLLIIPHNSEIRKPAILFNEGIIVRRTTTKNHVLHKKGKWVLSILLLAVLCFGAAELIACRIADPVLYYTVTAPARRLARQTAEAARAAADAVSDAAVRFASAAGHAAVTAADAIQEKASETAEAITETLAKPKVRVPRKQAAAGQGKTDAQLAGPSALAAPKGLVDASISHLEGRENLEFLTGGGIEVVYYNQTDERWSDTLYGSDPLSGYGCGPTSMSIVVSSLLHTPVDPEAMARECADRGYWARYSGSYLSIVEGISSAYGLECTSIPPEQLNKDDLMLHLANGDLAVALMTRGHFTNSGHFIVLRGLTLNGEILVADPASRERSLTPWDLSLIISELSPSRHDGAPLWLISAPAALE